MKAKQIWHCGQCLDEHETREAAEACCICEDCGIVLEWADVDVCAPCGARRAVVAKLAAAKALRRLLWDAHPKLPGLPEEEG